MRFMIAIVLFAVAFLGLGLGIAQRTIWAGPESFTATTETGSAPLTVIDGATLNALPGTQGISVSGSEQVFLAYGRTIDVRGWVGEADYNEVTWDAEEEELRSRLIVGTETEVPSPAGSDLWLQEFSGVEEITRKVNVPESVSVIIAADGTEIAPSELSITWPLDNSAPWSGPLIIGGTAALLGGLISFIWALLHARRGRGPRRKTPKLPRPPKPPQLRPAKQRKALPAATPHGRRRLMVAGAVALSASLALAGCESGGLVPEPTPTPTVPGQDQLDPPAVTPAQLERIVDDTLATIAEADESRDADLAETRLAGPAYDVRSANYTMRGRDSDIAPPPAIPTDQLTYILPQQYAGWPRTVLAVAKDDDPSIAPVALLMIQENPRDKYKVHYAMALNPTTVLPDVAPAELGAPRLPADQKLGLLSPAEIAPAYGDVLNAGEESEYAQFFDLESDTLLASIGPSYKDERRDQLPGTAKIEFSTAEGEGGPIALATADSGQLVAVEIIESEIVTPDETGAAINPTGAVKALLDKSSTTEGVRADYGVQLLFYVPPTTDEAATIQLLGFAQGLVAASETD